MIPQKWLRLGTNAPRSTQGHEMTIAVVQVAEDRIKCHQKQTIPLIGFKHRGCRVKMMLVRKGWIQSHCSVDLLVFLLPANFLPSGPGPVTTLPKIPPLVKVISGKRSRVIIQEDGKETQTGTNKKGQRWGPATTQLPLLPGVEGHSGMERS